MRSWVPIAIVLSYTAVVMLLALAGVFSETESRRKAAYKVLRVLLPWGLLAVAGQAAVNYLFTNM